jgi:hypothetical protein
MRVLTNVRLLCGVLVLGCATATAQEGLPQPSIQGVWRVVEVSSGGGVNKNPEPGLYVITAQHYSVVAINQPRPRLEDTTNATDAELRTVWAPLVAHSGTYRLSNGHVIWSPIVAKNPWVMGLSLDMSFTVTDKELRITDLSGQLIKLTRIE